MSRPSCAGIRPRRAQAWRTCDNATGTLTLKLVLANVHEGRRIHHRRGKVVDHGAWVVGRAPRPGRAASTLRVLARVRVWLWLELCLWCASAENSSVAVLHPTTSAGVGRAWWIPLQNARKCTDAAKTLFSLTSHPECDRSAKHHTTTITAHHSFHRHTSNKCYSIYSPKPCYGEVYQRRRA